MSAHASFEDLAETYVPSQLVLGRQFRDEGMSRVEQAESAEWNERCDAAILSFAFLGRHFTGEDVRELVGDPVRPNAMGPRFAAAARNGIIQKVGYIQSQRPSSHARTLPVWKGVK